jgi:hypothetical protein
LTWARELVEDGSSQPDKDAMLTDHQQPVFPETLSYVTGIKPRRWIAGRWSATEILALDKNGAQRTQYDRDVWLGLYAWNGTEWELEGVYHSRDAVRRAAARVRHRRGRRGAPRAISAGRRRSIPSDA